MKKTALILAVILILSSFVACGQRPVSYDNLISKYTELVACLKDGRELPSRENENEKEKAAYDALYAAVESAKENPEDMSYGIKDLNGDGADELILLSKYLNVYAVFTPRDGVATPLYDNGCFAVITKDGEFYLHEGALFNTKIQIKKIVNGELVGDEYGVVSETGTRADAVYYKIENGKRDEITFAEYLSLTDPLANTFSDYREIIEKIGITVVPAIKSEN